MKRVFPALLLAVLVPLTACQLAQTTAEGAKSAYGAAQAARARDDLPKLPAAGSPHAAGYDRDRFGSGWTDTDDNQCDTRDDILARDLTSVRRNGSCTVASGVLADPYTGRTIEFRRGAHSAAVQIDHLYPLHRAWQYGAWKWDERRRTEFANDGRNLKAVDGPANMAKGDSGPEEWLPKNQAYRCTYAIDYIGIARIYGLPVTRTDRAALSRSLASCPQGPEG